MADNKNTKVERSSYGNLMQSSDRKGDSVMQSEHDENPSRSQSIPMRVAAALRSDDQQFKVAGDDFGGMRHKPLSPKGTATFNDNAPTHGYNAAPEVTADRRHGESVEHLNQPSGSERLKEDFLPLGAQSQSGNDKPSDSVSALKRTAPNREQDHTPEINLDSWFPEDVSAPLGKRSSHLPASELESLLAPSTHEQRVSPQESKPDAPITKTPVSETAPVAGSHSMIGSYKEVPDDISHPSLQDNHSPVTASESHQVGSSGSTKRPRKLSKRERKAIKKREVEKSLGVLDAISTVLVGHPKKNSVSTPVLHLNEVFGAPPSDLPLTPSWDEDHHPSLTSVGASKVAAIAGGIGDNLRSIVGSIHKPAIMNQWSTTHNQDANQSSATSDHTGTLGSMHSQEHQPSKAGMLKTPMSKIILGLSPEEESNYPRADATSNIHENPAHSPSIMDAVEKPHRKPVTHSNGHAALKTPKPDLFLFDEEQADYPRGEILKLPENRTVRPDEHPQAVEEIQLDDAHRHPHHDLHPTITESATATVNQGIEGFKSLLDHLPTEMVTSAVASAAASAARFHIPSAPEIMGSTNVPSTAPEGSHLSVNPSHEVNKGTADVAPSSIGDHKGIVPVYTAPVSNVPLTSGSTVNHAMAPSLGTISHQQQVPEESHLAQEPQKFVTDEQDHHRRHMDIHPSVADEDLENQHVPDESIVPENDPAVVTNRKYKPVQVLPDTPFCSMMPVNEKGVAMVVGPKTVAAPPAAASHKDKKIPIAQPPAEWTDSLPTQSRISTGAAAPNIPAVVNTGPSAKIPIAQPPTQTDTASARRRGSLPGSFHASPATRAGAKDMTATKQDSRESTNPFAEFAARSSINKGRDAAREAAPLMAAAATSVKPDDVVIMNAGDNTHSRHHNEAAPTAATLLGSAASFDPAAKAKRPAGAERDYLHGQVHEHGHDHEEDKDLQEEKKDKLGDLSPAKEYAATHKPSPPAAAVVDSVTPEVLQRQQQNPLGSHDVHESATRKLGSEPVTKKPIATALPSAPPMTANKTAGTNTSAPTAATQPSALTHDAHNAPKELPPIPARNQYQDQHLNKPLPNPQAAPPEGKTATTTAPAAMDVPAGYHGPLPKVGEGEKIVWVKKTVVEQVPDDDHPAAGSAVHGTTGTDGTADTSGKGSDEHHKDNLLHRITHKLTGRRKSADPHPYHSTHHQQGDNAVHGRRGPAQ